jgi:hypothetical protein
MQRRLLTDSSRNKDVDQRSRFYSIAAAAASVSMLALAPKAHGSVVITNTNIPITEKGISIDLNHDGITDVHFKYFSNPGASDGSWYFSVKGVVGNAIDAGGEDALALARSAKIGPSAHFGNTSANPLLMENKYCNFYGCQLTGDWGANQPNKFVGVKFKIKGQIHYGWIRVTITTNKVTGEPMKGTVTEYGYETIANKIVLAGLASSNVAEEQISEQTVPSGPSLGALALGADALPFWRREDEAAVA